MPREEFADRIRHVAALREHRLPELLVIVAVQVHFGAARIDQQFAGAVVDIEGNVQGLLYDLHPFTVFPSLPQLPRDAAIVITFDLLQWRANDMRPGRNAAYFY